MEQVQTETAVPEFPYIRIEKAAEYLGCALSTMYLMIGRGDLTKYKLGRMTYVDREELLSLFEAANEVPEAS